jgi:hypothetical protein
VQITLDESTKSLSSPALQVQLRGTNESELIPIVDALAKALREEIELTAHAIKVARRDAIRRQYEKVESELRELREKYKNLARVRTPRDADEQLLQRNLLLDHLRIIQRKKTVVAAIDAKLASHEGVPKGDGGPSKALADKTDESRAAGGESADRLALLKSREMATAELRELEKEAGDLAKEAEELGRDDADGELEARTKELLRFTSLASKLELELDKADIDIKCGRAFLIETRLSY